MFINKTEEIWLPVPNYENYYHISSFGRLKSLEKQTIDCLGRISKRKEKIIRPDNHENYHRYKFWDGKNYLAHRLVALAFIPNPENKLEVNHIDFNTSNNHVSNLEWCTHKENNDHSYSSGRHDHRKRKIYQFDLEGNFIKEWPSIAEAITAGYKCLTGSDLFSRKNGKSKENYWTYERNLVIKPYELKTLRGEKALKSKFTDEQVIEIITNFNNGRQIVDIAKKYSVEYSTIWQMVKGTGWQHLKHYRANQ